MFKLQATKFRIDIEFYERPDDWNGVGNDKDEEEEWGPFEFKCYYGDPCESYERCVLLAYCDNANELAENINRMREDERLLPYLISLQKEEKK